METNVRELARSLLHAYSLFHFQFCNDFISASETAIQQAQLLGQAKHLGQELASNGAYKGGAAGEFLFG